MVLLDVTQHAHHPINDRAKSTSHNEKKPSLRHGSAVMVDMVDAGVVPAGFHKHFLDHTHKHRMFLQKKILIQI